MPDNPDYFLKIDGIQGESPDDKHKNEFQILSFHWGATQSGTNQYGGGGGAGKVTMGDFTFTMRTNVGSSNVMLACARGDHIASAVLVCRKATGKGGQQEYLIYTFKDFIISSFAIVGSGDNGGTIPIESFTFNFEQIQMESKPQNAQGGITAGQKTGWNLKKNKAV